MNLCQIEQPCQNNATCIDQPGFYICNCPSNYFGDRCETKIDYCASRPCRNDGLCLDGMSGFSCLCLDGFTGEICQNKRQACDSSPCQHGSCINTRMALSVRVFLGLRVWFVLLKLTGVLGVQLMSRSV